MRLVTKVLSSVLALLCWQLVFAHLAVAENTANKPPDEGKTRVEQARAVLARAKAYLEVEEYESAKKEIIQALQDEPDDGSFRQEGIKLWHEVEQARQVGQKRKNM